MRRISGFTLIELIVVISVLAILAAVALPRFIDLRGDAVRASAQGVAGALASGSAINFGGRAAGNGNATAVSTCAASSLTLAPGGGISFTFVTPARTVANGAVTACTISITDQGTTVSVTAQIIGAA